MEVKALIFADIHYTGIMPDAIGRLKAIIEAARREQADCILCLGDTAWSKPEFRDIADIWNGIELPHYMALGNHDMDRNSKEEVTAFYGLPSNYYSFDVKGLHFAALDTNYFRREPDGEVFDYDHANYAGQITDCMPQAQLDWLAEDLRATEKPTILLSHAPLYDDGEPAACCKEREALPRLLLDHNRQRGWKQAFLSCNGHMHLDSLADWDGIHYLEINSASNQWLGGEYALLEPDETFSAAQHEAYDCLRYTAPFRDPVYALLTFDLEAQTLRVTGPQSSYIGPTPMERGHSGYVGTAPLTAGTAPRFFRW